MYKFLILLILNIGLLDSIQAQRRNSSKIETEDFKVGFACYYSGTATKLVKKFENLIYKDDYNSIASYLNSDNSAERYLSVKIIERLIELEIYNISNVQSNYIAQSYNSAEVISVCSGCIYFDKIPLKDILSLSDFTKFDMETEYWLDKMLSKPNNK